MAPRGVATLPAASVEAGATMEVTVARRTSELGSLYKGREGQWSWIAHRVTGVGILLFLFAHIIDTALVGWGPEAYNRVISVYHHPIVQIMELGLVGAVIFHGLNGLRIMIIDFWPKASLHQARLFWTTMALFVAAMAPVTWVMGARILEDLGWF
jgi:succinate dehydrogenase / fumarate reductase cytochrome b subunit